MRVLQARFHFAASSVHEPLIVGHVVWDSDAVDARPSVQPSDSLRNQQWSVTILFTLQHLVATADPDPFHRLLGLQSRFWSFVDVSQTASPAIH